MAEGEAILNGNDGSTYRVEIQFDTRTNALHTTAKVPSLVFAHMMICGALRKIEAGLDQQERRAELPVGMPGAFGRTPRA